MLTARIGQAEAAFSPEDLSPEVLVAAYLMNRIANLPKESLQDLASLAPELAECDNAEAFREIAETVREILFPELLGDIDRAEIENTEKLRRHTEWTAGKIKTAREKAGLTQEELARKSGLPQSHISRLENAQHSPSQKTLERIAKALNMAPSALDPSSW